MGEVPLYLDALRLLILFHNFEKILEFMVRPCKFQQKNLLQLPFIHQGCEDRILYGPASEGTGPYALHPSAVEHGLIEALSE